MIQHLYVNNYRCLDNFELVVRDMPSSLLVGKNGSGKSTVRQVLEILQSIGRGQNRIKKLLSAKDFARGRQDVPIRFELEVMLNSKNYNYNIAFELPENFKELRVLEESLKINGVYVYSRQAALVKLNVNKDVEFFVDWHLVALPIIQQQFETDPIPVFKKWLSEMIVFSPIPMLMKGISSGETLEPELTGKNFGDWFSGLLAHYPSAYSIMYDYLKNSIMPDLQDIQNKPVGENAKSLNVQFRSGDSSLRVPFENLSDGEKCFFICALLVAASGAKDDPIFCFWDEPDNYISTSEVNHFVSILRSTFRLGGQILLTSHNTEAIRCFSDENTFVLDRKSHLEPTRIKLIDELGLHDSLVNSLISGDLTI